MKMTATQGVIFATLILATIGGALQVLATELRTVDLSWMGSYQAPFLAFFQNAWIIIVVTFLYNVFMYLRQNQLAALKQTADLYDWRKLVTTLAWFLGILGPMAALVSDVQVKGIISLTVILLTAFTQEISKIFGIDTTAPAPSSTSSTPATPTAPTTTNPPQQTTTSQVTAISGSSNIDVGEYQGWEVRIVNGFLNVYPPAAMNAVFGACASVGSVAGWPSNTDWITLAKPLVDVLIQNAQNSVSKIINPTLAQQLQNVPK